MNEKAVGKDKDMGGFFGVASKQDCVFDLFFGIDYHSHLGTRRGGMTVYGEDGRYEADEGISGNRMYFRL